MSGLILLAVGVRGGAPALPERRLWGQIALTGFFNMGLFQIFLIAGIATLGPSRTPIIIYTMPAWSALFAAFLLKERITLRVALSLALSLAAVGIIVSQETAARTAPVGTLLTLLAAISFGIGTVLTKRTSFRGDPTINAAWQILLGTIPVIAIWLVFARDAYFRPDRTLRHRRPGLADPGLERARLFLLVPHHSRAAGIGRQPDDAGGAVRRLRQQRTADRRRQSRGSMSWRSA